MSDRSDAIIYALLYVAAGFLAVALILCVLAYFGKDRTTIRQLQDAILMICVVVFVLTLAAGAVRFA